jgi:integrase
MDLFKSALGSDTPLAEITASRISDWKAARLSAVCKQTKRGYSAAAINRPLAALRHLLRLAHDEWEMLPLVPRIKLEREPQGRLRWLTQEEITALLAACVKSKNAELHPAVIVAINSGLRRSELLGLTWERVDLSRGVLRLELTKSGKRREVPLIGDSYRAVVSLEPKAAGRVFQTRSIRTAFENAVEGAKLDDVTFHTLRHTFASWAMMRGVSLKELQELLGHSSLAMTMRYAHLAPEHLRTAVSRLEGLTRETTEDRAQTRAHEQLQSVVRLESASEVADS